MAKRGVVAVLVTRGSNSGLDSLVEAVAGQTLPPDAILVIDVTPRGLRSAHIPIDADRLPKGVHLTRVRASNLGTALEEARQKEAGHGPLSSARWWWLLHEDTRPEADCLEHLFTAVDQGRTIAAVGPKQIDEDGEGLLELGIHATATGRRLERTLPGEIDQGQYDATTDVLAVGTAGMLLDAEAYEVAGPFDPLLGPYGDGLEYGRRLRRCGYRVVVAPNARIHHRRDALSRPGSFRRRRTAQLHNWTLATAWWMLLPLAIWLLVLTPLRALWRLLTARPDLAVDEFLALFALIARTPQLLAQRASISRRATVPRSTLKALEVRGHRIAERRRHLRSLARTGSHTALEPKARQARGAHRRATFTAFALLLVLTATASALTWASLGATPSGGAWLVAPARFGDLWEAAWASWIPGGDGHPGPADPLLALLSLIAAPASLLGVDPRELTVIVLWAALPASALSGWSLARTFTTSSRLAFAAGLLWAALPTLTAAISQGMLSAALVHAALPALVASWRRMLRAAPSLCVEGVHEDVELPRVLRSGAAGWAGLAALVVVAAHPLMVLPLTVVALATWPRLGRRALALVTTLLPGLVVALPFLTASVLDPSARAALLTPGAGPSALAVPRPWEILLGLPGALSWAPLRWSALAVGGALLAWAFVAVTVRAVSPGSPSAPEEGPKPLAGVALPAGGITGATVLLLLALLQSRVPVALGAVGVAKAWPGTLISLAALGLLVAALSTTPTPATWRPSAPRGLTALAGSVALVACAALVVLPAARTQTNDHAATQATGSPDAEAPALLLSASQVQVPAVSDQAQLSGRAGRVLALYLGNGVDLRVDIWRSPGQGLTDASALTRLEALHEAMSPSDDPVRAEVARLAFTLTVHPDTDTVEALADHGIDTVLVRDPDAMPERVEALERAPGLELVGRTDAGTVWRLRPDGLQPARVRLVEGEGWVDLDSTQLSTRTEVGESGLLVLAERSDPGWQATLDGQPLTSGQAGMVADAPAWAQTFVVDRPGSLVVTHRAWWLWPWWGASALFLLGTVVATVPVRRKQ